MEHYFSEKPVSKKERNIFHYTINSIDFIFHTSSSVFSKGYIDKGTELLIKESRIKGGSRILDIGCGYGAVGVILSRSYPETKIVMSDINERAISLAKENLKVNKSKGGVIQSNLFEKIEDSFDIILSNPPQHAGKKVCFKIIEESFCHLNKDGSLQLVARHQKGGKDLAKKMKEIFGNVETIGRKSGFHVYYSEKK